MAPGPRQRRARLRRRVERDRHRRGRRLRRRLARAALRARARPAGLRLVDGRARVAPRRALGPADGQHARRAPRRPAERRGAAARQRDELRGRPRVLRRPSARARRRAPALARHRRRAGRAVPHPLAHARDARRPRPRARRRRQRRRDRRRDAAGLPHRLCQPRVHPSDRLRGRGDHGPPVQRAPGPRDRPRRDRAAQALARRPDRGPRDAAELPQGRQHVLERGLPVAGVRRRGAARAVHRRPERRDRARVPRVPRRPDRPAEPAAAQQGAGARGRPREAPLAPGGTAVLRPRPLQGGQRRARPRRRRRAPARGLRAAARHRPLERPPRPSGWRRVRARPV